MLVAMPDASSDLLLVSNPLLGKDIEASLLALGRAPRVLEPSQVRLSELEDARRRGCRALVSVNRSPELAMACREAGLRYLSWTIDPLSRMRWNLVPGADEILFVHRRALIPPLLAMGHPRVEWLPLSAPARRWDDPRPSLGTSDPSFVGSSLLDERDYFLQRLSAWGLEAAGDALVGFLDAVAEVAEQDLSDRGFLVRPERVPEALVAAAEGRADRSDLAEALDAGLAWRFRGRVVGRLADLGCVVHGDDGWKDVRGGRWLGPLRNGREMTAHYAGAALNIDVPRLHQREIATLRAFDVLACGGVLCLEAGTELDDIFRPGEHFLEWRSTAERDEMVRSVRAGRGRDLDRMGEAAREAAWEHRLEVRVARILSEV